MERCGAKTRSGGRCKKTAGWGTDHTGQGKCRLHGGATPIKSGRYSTIKRAGVRQLIEHHAGDADPLDVLPEIAAARALFQDFVERYDGWRDAFLAWHASFGDSYLDHLKQIAARKADDGSAEALDELRRAFLACRELGLRPDDPLGYQSKPREVLDLADAVRHLNTIATIAQREKRLRLDNAVSRKDLLRILTEMTRVVEREVPEAAVQTRIRDGWNAIQLA